MLKNKYPLNQIYFYLTEGCNLCCRHCWIDSKHQNKNDAYPSLALQDFKYIITQAKPLGLFGVKLTGGEPLLHPKIREILEFIRIESLQLTVETNGVLCSLELAQAISFCKNPFVAVGIDGAGPKTHDFIRGVSGAYEKAIEGLRNLVKAGLKPQIIMSVMRYNKEELKEVVALAERLGAGSVKFNIVQPTARGEQMRKKNETLSIDELIELGSWVENTLSKETTISIYYSHPAAFRPLSKLSTKDGTCGTCSIQNIIGVLGDGSYVLCGIGQVVPELVFGQASKNRLEEVWHNTPTLNALRQGLPHQLKGICKECLMKNYCLGSCIAQNYYRTKDLWAAFWYCEEAYQKGLFPGTRLNPKVFMDEH